MYVGGAFVGIATITGDSAPVWGFRLPLCGPSTLPCGTKYMGDTFTISNDIFGFDNFITRAILAPLYGSLAQSGRAGAF